MGYFISIVGVAKYIENDNVVVTTTMLISRQKLALWDRLSFE